MKKLLFGVLLGIIIWCYPTSVSAQTPIKTCCTAEKGMELGVGMTFSAINHEFYGFPPSRNEYPTGSISDGSEFKFFSTLDIPVNWKFIDGLMVGFEYKTRSYENIFDSGYDWDQDIVSFTIGFKVEL